MEALALYTEAWLYTQSRVWREQKECMGSRMTLVTAKTLNYDWNEISETPVIDYESHCDSTA